MGSKEFIEVPELNQVMDRLLSTVIASIPPQDRNPWALMCNSLLLGLRLGLFVPDWASVVITKTLVEGFGIAWDELRADTYSVVRDNPL